MNELISVIVPIYNVEQYLKQCIDSILNQTYQNLEIILVDDGSPDNCGKICDEYALKDKRIKVIHKENGGLSSARNAGLDIATGMYVSFIDSDDYISSKFIENLHSIATQKNVDIVQCNFVRFENEIVLQSNNKNVIVYTSREMQLNLYSNEYIQTVITCNKIYKKYIYNELRFPDGKVNEDEFTTYKAFENCKGKIAVTNEELYYYRYNFKSITGQKFNVNRLDALQAIKEQISFYTWKNDQLLIEKAINRYQEKLKDYYCLIRKNIDNPKDYLKNIIHEMRNNYSNYMKIKDNKTITKIKITLFTFFPKIYSFVLLNFSKKNNTV